MIPDPVIDRVRRICQRESRRGHLSDEFNANIEYTLAILCHSGERNLGSVDDFVGRPIWALKLNKIKVSVAAEVNDFTNIDLATSERRLEILHHGSICSAFDGTLEVIWISDLRFVLVFNKHRRACRSRVSVNASALLNSWLKVATGEERKLSVDHCSCNYLLSDRERLN